MIDEESLYFRTGLDADFDDSLRYNITKQPKHGTLQILLHGLQTKQIKPAYFDQKLIKQKRLVYEHDNSENEMDHFEFVISNASHAAILNGKFNIEVIMKNDNAPTRCNNRTLNVIRNGQKRLSRNDLEFVDEDIGTGADQIVYSNVHLSAGTFQYLNGSSLTKFTQQDINNGDLVYKHSGPDNVQALLWVSDGQYYLSTNLNIQASDAYLSVVTNTGLVVKYGENGVISHHNLSIETNMDVLSKRDVLFKLTTEPKYGQLLINDKPVNQFTLQVSELVKM